MKWIRASERLPEKARDISVDPGIIFRKITRTNTFVCHTSIRSFSFMGDNLAEWEWLDESPSESEAVEFAKREVIEELEMLLDKDCYPEYLPEVIRERIEEIKNPKPI